MSKDLICRYKPDGTNGSYYVDIEFMEDTLAKLQAEVDRLNKELSAPLPNGANAREYAEKIYKIQSDYTGVDHRQYCTDQLAFFIGSLLNAKPDPEPTEKDDE